MWNDNGGTVRAVAWSEICPWLRLFRCFRLALGFGFPLLLSALAILVTVTGWAWFGWLFSGDPEIAEQMEPYQGCPWLALTDLVPDKPKWPDLGLGVTGDQPAPDAAAEQPPSIFRRSPEPFWGSFAQLSRPLWEIFSSDVTVSKLAFFALSGLWAVAVWGFFGGALTRRAAVELAGEQHVSANAMMRYARSRWRTYCLAPLGLLVGVAFVAFGMAIVGLMLRSDISLAVAGLLLWPLMLLGGFFMAYLLVWLALGWPLMWAATSAEGGDSFDALSRSNQYLCQRPLHYLFYVLVAVVIGWIGWLVVSNFAAAVIALTHWAVDWGADSSRWLAEGSGSRRVEEVLSPGAPISPVGAFGAQVVLFWCGCVKLLAVGFLYSYFWTASTCIYLLLRYDADAVELDEVFLEEDEEEATYGLPPVGTDGAGAPVVADDTAPPGEEVSPSGESEPSSQSAEGEPPAES
jgi:hypothetical protein